MSMMKRFGDLEKRRINCSIKSYLWVWSGIIGNIFFSRSVPEKITENSKNLLNLGCGSRHLDGWVNADFYRLHNLIWNRKSLPNWMLDLTKPLKCNSDYWDGVLLEHTNEHLSYTQNLLLFKEVFRTLKPGGVLRVIVPDLDRDLQWNEVRSQEPKMARYYSLAEAVSNLTQNHLHIAVWNFDLLVEVLKEAGFSDVNRSEYGNTYLPEMNVDMENHKWESLYVEAHK